MRNSTLEEIKAKADAGSEELAESSATIMILKTECEYALNGKSNGEKVIEMLHKSGTPLALEYVMKLQAAYDGVLESPPSPKPTASPATPVLPAAIITQEATPPTARAIVPEPALKAIPTPDQPEAKENKTSLEKPGRSSSPSKEIAETIQPERDNSAMQGAVAAKPKTEEPDLAATKNNAPSGNLVMVDVEELHPHPLIEHLYETDQNTLESLKEEVKANGSRNIPAIQAIRNPDGYLGVIEGLTRLKAARETGLQELSVQIVEVSNDKDILLMAIQMQCKRRQADDPTMLKSIKALKPYSEKIAKERQGKKTSGQNCPEVGEGANGMIGQIIGKSSTYVKHAKLVLNDNDLEEVVMKGSMSLNQAYEAAKQKKQAAADKATQSKDVPMEDAVNTCNAPEDNAASDKTEENEGIPAQESKPESKTNNAPVESSTPASETDSIEAVAHALAKFTPEELWQCLSALPNEMLQHINKHIIEKLNQEISK